MSRHRPEPSILDRLQVGGLDPDIVAEWRTRKVDAHRKRQPCHCALCEPYGPPLTWATDSGGGGESR